MTPVSVLDIDRDQTLRELIDDLVDTTDWTKFTSIRLDLDEPDFIVSIEILKKAECLN